MNLRRHRRLVGLLLAALTLFAQGAIAFAACDLVRSTASHALARVGASATADQPCHEPSENTNLCLAHCLAGDQSLDKPNATVPALAAVPMLALRAIYSAEPASVATRRLGIPPSSAPPPRILFRTLRI